MEKSIREINNNYCRVFESKNTNIGHCLPVDLSKYNVKGTRVICLNTHVLNFYLSPDTHIFNTLPITIISLIKGSMTFYLKNLLAFYGLLLPWMMSDQMFAVDIVSTDSKFSDKNCIHLKGFPITSINNGIIKSIEMGIDNVLSEVDKMRFKYGNHIIIDHGNFYSLYAHLEKGSSDLKVGDKVTRGQKIARLGHSGNSDKNAPHLHFEMLNFDIQPKNTIFNPLFDIPKMRTGFSPYKCAEFSYKDILHLWNMLPKKIGTDLKNFKDIYFNKKITLNTSGELSGTCFLTDLK